MPVSHTHLATVQNAGNANTYTIGPSVTPPTNKLLGFWVASNDVPTSVTGAGITFTQILSTISSTNRMTFFVGIAASPTTQQITVNFSGNQNEIGWSLVYFDDVDLSGGAAAAIVQAVGGANNNTTLSINLSSFANANNATAGAMRMFLNGNITAGSGFTEMGEADGTDTSIQSQFKNSPDTTVDWSWGSTSLGVGIAVEIKFLNPESSSVSPSVSPSSSLSRSASASVSPSSSISPSSSVSASSSRSVSPSASLSPSISGSPSSSQSPSVSPSSSRSPSSSQSPSSSISPSPVNNELCVDLVCISFITDYDDKYQVKNTEYENKYSEQGTQYEDTYNSKDGTC